MIKKCIIALLAALSFALMPTCIGLAEQDEKAEWTVLFYFCGSDLESRHSYATGNLEEISECIYPFDLAGFIKNGYSSVFGPVEERTQKKVNVLIETGGCEEWHAQALGMDIDAGSLQRWRYSPEPRAEDGGSGFSLEETLPLASMADPETLGGFISWSAARYPANKYALVLWDHGGGSKTGLFVDELFDGDVMLLSQLENALTLGGVRFEAVLFDACMMANVETAYQLRDHAAWMIASEEVVPGRGTNVEGWLQELLNDPGCDGRSLGRCICDMTQIKYGNLDDEQAKSILTWSLIDLSKVEHLAEVCERFFKELAEAYMRYPKLLQIYMQSINTAEKYGTGSEYMRDLADIFYDPSIATVMDPALRTDMLSALQDCVVYNVRGPGRSAAHGLSFCQATSFTENEMDVYGYNSMSPTYLAILDAISPWTAPDWVYEQAKQLPDVDIFELFHTTLEKRYGVTGVPGYFVDNENAGSINNMYYSLYHLNENTGEVISLGWNVCRAAVTEDGLLWSAIEPWSWLSVEGMTCCIQTVSTGRTECLYNIPISLGTERWNLRCGRKYNRFLDEENTAEGYGSEYVIYGLWEGFDDDSVMPSRNVMELSKVAGQDFRLLYPIDSEDEDRATAYEASQTMTLYRALEVVEKPLKNGTYYIEYEIEDVLLRRTVLDRFEMYWDGEKLMYPEEFLWEGSVELE
ncbi:MAG: hypothetical protein E7317_04880 [Clostridiales bacterium]|nr:hypothetical protein [Clostridiales bacterium]